MGAFDFSILLASLSFMLFMNNTYGQPKNTYNTRVGKAHNVIINGSTVKGDVLKSLQVSKYIRSDKPVVVLAGFAMRTSVADLMKGGIRTFIGSEIENIVSFRAIQGRLSVNSTVKSIDQKVVAIVRDNKLIVNKGLYQQVTDRYLQVTDEYGVPVLQIILDNRNNKIQVNGVFPGNSYCYIISDSSFFRMSFPKPFLLMNEAERDAMRYRIIREASSIKRID